MSYRERMNFDGQSAEDVLRVRRTFAWQLPLLIVVDTLMIFRRDGDVFAQFAWTVAWSVSALMVVWTLLGLPMRWLPDRDRQILDDDWQRYLSGEAGRWGIAATLVLGSLLTLASFRFPLDGRATAFLLVNGTLLVAVARYSWLNRAESDDDE